MQREIDLGSARSGSGREAPRALRRNRNRRWWCFGANRPRAGRATGPGRASRPPGRPGRRPSLAGRGGSRSGHHVAGMRAGRQHEQEPHAALRAIEALAVLEGSWSPSSSPWSAVTMTMVRLSSPRRTISVNRRPNRQSRYDRGTSASAERDCSGKCRWTRPTRWPRSRQTHREWRCGMATGEPGRLGSLRNE